MTQVPTEDDLAGAIRDELRYQLTAEPDLYGGHPTVDGIEDATQAILGLLRDRGLIGGVSDTATSCAPDRPESDRIVAETDESIRRS